MPKQPSSSSHHGNNQNNSNNNNPNQQLRFNDLFPTSAFQRSQQHFLQNHSFRRNNSGQQQDMNHHQTFSNHHMEQTHTRPESASISTSDKQLHQQAILLEQYFTQLLNQEPSFQSLLNHEGSSGGVTLVDHLSQTATSTSSTESIYSNHNFNSFTSNNNNTNPHHSYNYMMMNNNFHISMNESNGRTSNNSNANNANNNTAATSTTTPLSSNSYLASSPQRNFLSSFPTTSTPIADTLSKYLEQFDQQFGFAPSSNSGSMDIGVIEPQTSSTSSSFSGRNTTQQASLASPTSSSHTSVTVSTPSSSSSSAKRRRKRNHLRHLLPKRKKQQQDHHSSEEEDGDVHHSENVNIDEENNATPGFHPIACVPCRRLHKRCDKKYPSCSKCLSRGVTCEYKIPRKKGRIAKPKGQQQSNSVTNLEKQDKNDNSNNTNSNKQEQNSTSSLSYQVGLFNSSEQMHSSTNKLLTNIVQTESTPYAQGTTRNQPEKHLDKRKVLDLYYNVFTENMIVIERKEFENYLSMRTSTNSARDEEEEIINSLNETEIMPNKKEVYVLFLCIKAVCEQRVGLVDLAEETGKKARDALSKIFDEHSNFYVACAFAYLSIYEAGCGRLKTAKYYLNSLNFYFDELTEEEEQNMTPYQRNLKKIRSFVNICAKNDQGVLHLLKDWPGVYEKILGITLPTEWKTILSQDLTVNNYMAVINVVEALLKVVRLHITKSGTVKNLKVYDMGQTFVSNGVKIGILSAVNRGKELIEECALKITLATELELFVFVPPPIVAHCVAAAKVHLHIVKAIENGERQNPEIGMIPSITGGEPTLGTIDYYEILSKDLRALNILAKRYKKVSLFHKSLMNEMEDIIQRKHIMSAMKRVCSSFSDDGLYPPNNFVSGLLNDLEKMRTNSTTSTTMNHLCPLPSTQQQKPSITDLGHNITTISCTSGDFGGSNNLLSDSEMDFSEFEGVRNTKDFLATVTSSSTGNEPLQELINESFLESLNSGNMNMEDTLKDESFFEPFLNSEDVQELFASDFSPHDSPPQQ
ncbi:hypothetical protein FDP41_003980 [Naegleria fowleri]|uniref:Zn(2)-C6 fungal-type domain-containing protein n=1 Tax=Naegleria fowleri TaxID=5763 RepID=A0A6A5BTG1_NAEFO|nr:uncharacterized protein FDP41_003980 [Naegleria fowleri]KAF0976685.1 hypothetical protein FDP41_003980 [Naegleria fowleri]